MPRQEDPAKLEFIVRFVQMDPDTMRPGDWLNLRDDLRRYLSFERDVSIINKDDPNWTTTLPEVITDIHREIRDLVCSWVDMHMAGREAYKAFRKQYPHQPDTITVQTSVGIQGAFTLEYMITVETPPGGRTRTPCNLYGDPQSAVLYAVWLDLQHAQADQVLRCPECETLFVRVRKQVYCSRACLNRSGIRRWRGTDTGKQYEETRARTRYKQKTQAKTSSNTKVKRNHKGVANARTSRQS